MTMLLISVAISASFSKDCPNTMGASTQTQGGESYQAAAGARLQSMVKEILAVWARADVVRLGEDHGRKFDEGFRLELERRNRITMEAVGLLRKK